MTKKEFDIAPYGDFEKYPYDNLSGHELLQMIIHATQKIIDIFILKMNREVQYL